MGPLLLSCALDPGRFYCFFGSAETVLNRFLLLAIPTHRLLTFVFDRGPFCFTCFLDPANTVFVIVFLFDHSERLFFYGCFLPVQKATTKSCLTN